MAADDDHGKSGEAGRRHIWGPQSVGALVPALTRPVFKKRAPASAQILSDWASIAGPGLAAVTAPRRLSGTTLTLACSGPVALELQHNAGLVMARINGHLGRVAVERLRFVQDAPPAAAPTSPPPSGPAPEIDLLDIPPGPLRDALTALGQSVHLATRRPG